MHKVNNIFNFENTLTDFEFRIKSAESVYNKIERLKKKEIEKGVNIKLSSEINNLLGFRIHLNDKEEEIINFLGKISEKDKRFKVINLLDGKMGGDGYRVIHVYFSEINKHLQIEKYKYGF